MDPREALAALQSVLLPDGTLSLLFYNKHAIMWRYLMNGNNSAMNYTQSSLEFCIIFNSKKF